ncbi:MAG: hypothetical protein H6713_07605 [Myxococcales bacterium]|nr:hypothetical protein [Myxococcales bacterium]
MTHIAGHPRWRARQGERPLEWIEVPVIAPRRGPPELATQQDRRAGRLRGGKAHGDDGTEPTVMAAPVVPGGGDVELRYVRWLPVDIVGALLSLASALALALLACGGPASRRCWCAPRRARAASCVRGRSRCSRRSRSRARGPLVPRPRARAGAGERACQARAARPAGSTRARSRPTC